MEKDHDNKNVVMSIKVFDTAAFVDDTDDKYMHRVTVFF